MTNRVNAHLKRAHDLLKQSSKAFGAPRLSIRSFLYMYQTSILDQAIQLLVLSA